MPFLFIVMVYSRSWSLVCFMVLSLDLITAIVEGFLLFFHLFCFWRIPYLIHDMRAEYPRGSLVKLLLLSVVQGILDLFFLPFTLVLIAHPLHTIVIFAAMSECCRNPRQNSFRIFVICEFLFAVFEVIFVALISCLSLHRIILLPVIYWQDHRSSLLTPALLRSSSAESFGEMFWILSDRCLQNVENAWNDLLTLIVIIPCLLPMIVAPWRLFRAISLCFVTESHRKSFYRTRFTANVVYYMRIFHHEIKELSHKACDDCKNGRFLWMQYRVRRFEELRGDAMSSISELVQDIGFASQDHGVDAKPEDRRLSASMRIVLLCATLQDKMFKDRCVLFPDQVSRTLTHAADNISFQDIVRQHQPGSYASGFLQSHLESLYQQNPSEFADPESFEKLSKDLAADVGELDDRLQNECQYDHLEKCLIKLHMCSCASHHSKQDDYDDCMDKVMKIELVALLNIIKNLPPQAEPSISALSIENFAERSDIRYAFVSCLILALFDLFVLFLFPLALVRRKLLFSAIAVSRKIDSSRAATYCAFRIAFRVFLDFVLLLFSVGILLSVVGTLPFISRMYDAWKSGSMSYARNIIIVLIRDFFKWAIASVVSCGAYNFAILFWSLFLVGFWAGFLPAMIVYVAASNIDILKNHKLFGCFFSFAFWVSIAIIVPMYGLFVNVSSPRVLGSEFGSIVWFLIIMILISVIAAVHLSLNRDQSKPVFSASTQQLPTRKNFENAAALFDVILDGIQ